MNGDGVRAAVGLGSNLGDREAQLAGALERLAATPGLELLAVSPWFENAAVGGPPGQGDFLNGVCLVRCELSARALLERLQAIEAAGGRRRGVPWGPRTLDLDLLLFDDQVIEEPDLIVPHPRLAERDFVLLPLSQVAPELELPGSGRTAAELLAQLRGGAGG